MFKSGTALRISLEKELNIPKQNAVENKHLITEKERILALYNEAKIWEEVLENKRFENLNNKKMTPYFLSLVKGSKKEDSLNNIVDENGTPFNSDEERKTYIRESFEKLYKIPDDEVVLEADSITNFFGGSC